MFSRQDNRIEVNVLQTQSPAEIYAWVQSFTEKEARARVIMAPFEHPLDFPKHLRFKNLPDDELFTAQGQCLCCALKSPLADSLRSLFMMVLTKQEPKVSAVYVLTQAKKSDLLLQTLKHAPFLAQRYRFGVFLCMNATNMLVNVVE
jgi:hypothetical protein